MKKTSGISRTVVLWETFLVSCICVPFSFAGDDPPKTSPSAIAAGTTSPPVATSFSNEDKIGSFPTPLPAERILPVVDYVAGGSFKQVPAVMGKAVDYYTGAGRNVVVFKTFDIEANHRVAVHQASADTKSLFNVTGKDPSIIRGYLSVDQGHVFLTNQNGIFFAKDAVLDISKLAAVGGVVDYQQFLTGDGFGIRTSDLGAIWNAATVNVKDRGLFSMIGRSITNTGHVLGRQITFQGGAGKEFYISFAGHDHVAFRVQGNEATVAEGAPALMTVNQAESLITHIVSMGGIVEATHATEDGRGYIVLQGDKVEAKGTLKNKGGDINLGGKNIEVQDNAYLDVSHDILSGKIHVGDRGGNGIAPTDRVVTAKSSVITAEGTGKGKAGEVVLYADKVLDPKGKLSVENSGTGDGGFLELSVKHGNLDTSDLNLLLGTKEGKKSLFMLDPTYIAIGSDAWSWGVTPITESTLQGWLNSSSVLLQADSGIGFGTNFSWSSDNDLQLKVGDDSGNIGKIYFSSNPSITSSGYGSLYMYVHPTDANSIFDFNGGTATIVGNSSNNHTMLSLPSAIALTGSPWTSFTLSNINRFVVQRTSSAPDFTSIPDNYDGYHLTNDLSVSTSWGNLATGKAFIAPTFIAPISDNLTSGASSLNFATDNATTANTITFSDSSNGLFGNAILGGNLIGYLNLKLGADIVYRGSGNYGVLVNSMSNAQVHNIAADGNGYSLDGESSSGSGVVFGTTTDVLGTGIVKVSNPITLNVAGALASTMSTSGPMIKDLRIDTLASGIIIHNRFPDTPVVGSLTTAGDVNLKQDIITSSTQTYAGAVTLGNDVLLTTTDANITFGNTITGGSYGLAMNTGSGITAFEGEVSVNYLNPRNTSLSANITTTGIQRYSGAVTLGNDVTLTTTDSSITFGSTLDDALAGTHTLTTVTGTAGTEFDSPVGGTTPLAGLSTQNANIQANITTTGPQTYVGTVGVVEATNITLTTTGGADTDNITLSGNVDGLSYFPACNLIMTTTGSSKAIISGHIGSTYLSSLTVHNTLELAGSSTLTANNLLGTKNITLDAVTGQNYDLTLSADTITLNDTLTNVGAFSIASGTFSLPANAFSGLGSLNISPAFTLDQNITTTGTQRYGGAVTLGNDVTLTTTDSSITFGSTLDDALAGTHTLTTSTGNDYTVFENTVGGTAPLAGLSTKHTVIRGGSITTTGAQTYNGSVLLGGGSLDHTLTTTGNTATDNITFSSGVDSESSSAQHNLTTSTNGSKTVFNGSIGYFHPLGSLSITGSTLLNSAAGYVNTAGTQTYNDTLELGGASILLNASDTITLHAVTGNNHSLGIIGNVIVQDTLTNIQNLLIQGNTTLNIASIETSGAQSYTGTLTLSADTTLQAGSSIILLNVSGPTYALTLDSASAILSGADLKSVSVTGVINLGGTIMTTGAQTYNNGTFLGSDTTISASSVSFGDYVVGTGALNLTTTGGATFASSIGTTNNDIFSSPPSFLYALSSLDITGLATIDSKSIITVGQQHYRDAVTFTADPTLVTQHAPYFSSNPQSRWITFDGIVTGSYEVYNPPITVPVLPLDPTNIFSSYEPQESIPNALSYKKYGMLQDGIYTSPNGLYSVDSGKGPDLDIEDIGRKNVVFTPNARDAQYVKEGKLAWESMVGKQDSTEMSTDQPAFVQESVAPASEESLVKVPISSSSQTEALEDKISSEPLSSSVLPTFKKYPYPNKFKNKHLRLLERRFHTFTNNWQVLSHRLKTSLVTLQKRFNTFLQKL